MTAAVCTRPNFPYPKVYALAYLHRLSSHKEKSSSRAGGIFMLILSILASGDFPKEVWNPRQYRIAGYSSMLSTITEAKETVRAKKAKTSGFRR